MAVVVTYLSSVVMEMWRIIAFLFDGYMVVSLVSHFSCLLGPESHYGPRESDERCERRLARLGSCRSGDGARL